MPPPAPAQEGAPLERCRGQAKKEAKRKLDEAGGAVAGLDSSSGSDGDDAAVDSEGEERLLGAVVAPCMRLELVCGPHRGKTVTVGAAGLSIGASAHCGLAFPSDWSVSSLHARINHADGVWRLADCDSAGGTFLLLPDEGMALDAGDLVRIGQTEITMHPCAL